MLIENGADMLSDHVGLTTVLWAFSAWLRDPAVLTAIASLVTAIAAFFRVRHGSANKPVAQPEPLTTANPSSKAYETLFDVEDRIREELLLQLQNLQEEAEIIDQDLAAYQHANATLKGLIVRCSVAACPARGSLLKEL